MKRVGIISQARLSSTRLPRKVLLPIGGKPMIEYHLDRLSQSGYKVYVATSSNTVDDSLTDYLETRAISFSRGSEEDVLSRYYECALQYGLEVIVRVTSDCPLIDGVLIKSATDRYLTSNNPCLYLTNTVTRTFPRGFDFEIFSMKLLEQAHFEATNKSEREHVTPFLRMNIPGNVQVEEVLRTGGDASEYRLTVDTPEDFSLITALIEEHSCAQKTGEEIITVLEHHPSLTLINAHIEQKKDRGTT